jgi:hypothetical protein
MRLNLLLNEHRGLPLFPSQSPAPLPPSPSLQRDDPRAWRIIQLLIERLGKVVDVRRGVSNNEEDKQRSQHGPDEVKVPLSCPEL